MKIELKSSKPFTTIFANRNPRQKGKVKEKRSFFFQVLPGFLLTSSIRSASFVQKCAKSRSRGLRVPTARCPLRCVDDGDDGSEEGTCESFGQLLLFPRRQRWVDLLCHGWQGWLVVGGLALVGIMTVCCKADDVRR